MKTTINNHPNFQLDLQSSLYFTYKRQNTFVFFGGLLRANISLNFLINVSWMRAVLGSVF